MITYINLRTPEGVETVDEFPTRKAAFVALKDYKEMGGAYYTSSRATKDWYANGGGYGATKKGVKP